MQYYVKSTGAMQSKKFIFIDNDGTALAQEDADEVKNCLELAGIPDSMLNSMQIYPDFSQMSSDDAMKLLFSGEHIICTSSMYTSNHYDSLGQMVDMFRAAGRNDIKGLIYIDGSGKLLQALDGVFHFDKMIGSMSILNAIETKNGS